MENIIFILNFYFDFYGDLLKGDILKKRYACYCLLSIVFFIMLSWIICFNSMTIENYDFHLFFWYWPYRNLISRNYDFVSRIYDFLSRSYDFLSCISWIRLIISWLRLFSSPEPKAVVVVVVVETFHIFIFFSRTTGPISTKFGTKNPWLKGIPVCSNEGPHLFPRVDNYEIAKIHGRN